MAGHLSQGEWNQIFNLVTGNPHAAISDAEELLPNKYRTTVARALLVARLLLDRKSMEFNEEIAGVIMRAAGYGTTERYVFNAYHHYHNWLGEKGHRKSPSVFHQENLRSAVALIRSCLEHPALNDLPDYRELLEMRRYDWRLDPITWFYLCTPDFADTASWGKEFVWLRSHMAESPFWEHLKQLKQAVDDLKKDYDRVAIKLFRSDQQLRKFWTKIQVEQLKRERNRDDRPSRTAHTPEPPAEDLQQYYDQDYAKTVMQKLKSADGSFTEKQLELEKMLDQLNDDLLPDEIDPIILSGRCDKCP